MKSREEVMKKIRGGLIVSCQALESEPLYSPYIMSKMAYAAMLGGACGIRANTGVDIQEIKKLVDLPVIGIIKKVYSGFDVFITPTEAEVDELVACGTEVIAMDATKRMRPNGRTLKETFETLRKKYPDQLFMADCSCYEEGIHAAGLGFDFVGTTLSGYTDYTRSQTLPNYSLMNRLSTDCGRPVIAEGGIWERDQLAEAYRQGIYSAVVGTAITRPMLITERFATVVPQKKEKN